MSVRSFQHDAAELGQRLWEERNGADPAELAAIDRKISARIILSIYVLKNESLWLLSHHCSV